MFYHFSMVHHWYRSIIESSGFFKKPHQNFLINLIYIYIFISVCGRVPDHPSHSLRSAHYSPYKLYRISAHCCAHITPLIFFIERQCWPLYSTYCLTCTARCPCALRHFIALLLLALMLLQSSCTASLVSNKPYCNGIRHTDLGVLNAATCLLIMLAISCPY